MKPLANNVLIKPIKEEVKSSILLPDKKEVPQKGEVLAIGNEVKRVSIGDMVYYKKWQATDIEENIIIEEKDILAKL